MEQMDQQGPQQGTRQEPSYWSSVGIVSVIFGIIVFAITLSTIYITIGSEPSGSMLNPTQFIGIFACLIGAFGGMAAIWHYAGEYDITMKLGRGALIGAIAGVGIAVVASVLNQLWSVVDPNMTQEYIDSMVAQFEAMDLPSEQKQTMIDSTVENIRNQRSIGYQLLWNVPVYALLNLLTGLLGVKLFAQEDESEQIT